jgi:predicted HAD superfamily Cof-like phosphohydrolase
MDEFTGFYLTDTDIRRDTHAGVDIPLDILEFHRKFGLEPAQPPSFLDPEMQKFRSGFIREEADEYEEAIAEGDLEKAFDALIDLVYVAVGTAYLHGFRFAEGWSRVHGKNMEKIRAERADDSKRGTAYDVVKPEGWTPPDHRDLCMANWRVMFSDGDHRDVQAPSRQEAIKAAESERIWIVTNGGIQVEEAFPV